MHDEHTNAVEIARLDEQIKGLREQQRAHAEKTELRFDKLDGKIDSILETVNRGKGAYAASMVIAGIIGAAGLKAINFLYNTINR